MNKKLALFINLIQMGYKNKKPFIITTYYKSLINFIHFLNTHGFILSYQILPNQKLKILFKYFDDTPAITELRLISTPTYKIYKTYEELFSEKKKGNISKQRVYSSQKNNSVNKSLESFHINQLSYAPLLDSWFKDVSWYSQISTSSFNSKVIPSLYKNHSSLVTTTPKRSFLHHNTLNTFSKSLPQEAFFVLSTSQGFMTHQEAYLKRLGGLLICKIY